MSAWEKYLHSNEKDPLVQLAVLHAEFESIHPFLDGNGRLGRMIVPLFMYERKLLRRPVFYVSAYLDAHCEEYYERLLAVSRDDDWTGWCEFFLRGVTEQVNDNCRKADAILRLYNKQKGLIADLTRSYHSSRALDFVFGHPVFRSSVFCKSADIPEPTAKRFLKILRDNKVLSEVSKGSGQRPAVYAFNELLDITEGNAAFTSGPSFKISGSQNAEK